MRSLLQITSSLNAERFTLKYNGEELQQKLKTPDQHILSTVKTQEKCEWTTEKLD